VAGAVVVGGSSGIGRACAELLVERGWKVVVLDLHVPDVALAGVEAVLEVDVRDTDAVEDALADAEARIGTLTGAVHAAGTARVTPLLEITRKEWDLVVGVNLTGAWNVLSAVARRFVANGGGAFVALSSVEGGARIPRSRRRARARRRGNPRERSRSRSRRDTDDGPGPRRA
jgi:NAD(P)-dependent dehydrogenase (short-subunit alcohol dehydrogenase family)